MSQEDIYITGHDQKLFTHLPNAECYEFNCVVHNPSNHSMRAFPTYWRFDRGLMERICPHGIGHPDPDDLAFQARLKGQAHARAESIHGCDGCCA